MVDIDTYRCVIGRFTSASKSRNLRIELFHGMFIMPLYVLYNVIIPQLLLKCNDIEQNPGPVRIQTQSEIRFCHLNVRSILSQDQITKVTKHDELCAMLATQRLDLVGITETWLDQGVQDSHLEIPGYTTPLRRDRSRHGGGVMVYLSESLPAKRRADLEPPTLEIICTELQLGSESMLLCVCYRPPGSNMRDFIDGIEGIIERCNNVREFIFTGDFNAKHSSWCSTDSTNSEGRALKSFFDSVNHQQLIREPTRTGIHGNSCLDLIFTSSHSLFKSWEVLPALSNCDHSPVCAQLKAQHVKGITYKRHVWDYKRGDYDKFRNLLFRTRWDSVFVKENVNDMCKEFMDILELTAKECVPNYTCTIRTKEKPWMTKEIKNAIRTRNRLFNQIKRGDKSAHVLKAYRQCRNSVVHLVRLAKQLHEAKLLNTLNSTKVNSGQWWKCLRKLRGNDMSKSIPPLSLGDQVVTDSKQKADMFNTYFVSQSTMDVDATWDPGIPPASDFSIDTIATSSDEVYNILSHLDVAKATGPDGIGCKLLREAAPCISTPLARIFNYSFSQAQFPDIWKIAHVVPLYKKGDADDISNYRPVSLLSCISKVIERIVYNRVFKYLQSHNLLSVKQSGFTPGDSTINQLLKICHNIYQTFDQGDEARGVFLDFSKAFDKVWHKGLLYKLQKMGLNGSILAWITNYLSGRRQQVVVHGCASDIGFTNSGVPQGSVLGPLLFLVYINDITESLESDVYIFADDTSIFTRLNKNSAAATAMLNRDLKRIQSWCEKWYVKVNVTKTTSVLFSRKRQPSYEFPLYLYGKQIPNVQSHKQLGMILSRSLDWHEHIEFICSKSLKRINAWKELQYKISRKHMENCLSLFVLPVLDYGDILYDNCSVMDKTELDDVLLAAARAVTGAKRCTSHQLLYDEVGWQPLQQRRKAHKLCKFYAIVNGHTPEYLRSLLPRNLNTSVHNTRGSINRAFVLYVCRTECFRKSFFPSTTLLYNDLPPAERNCNSVKQFKRNMKKSLKSHVPSYYYEGSRKLNIILSQMRMQFCDLNFYLHRKGCIDSAMCNCGESDETLDHYFFHCRYYMQERFELLDSIQDIVTCVLNYNLMIFGKIEFDNATNILIQNCVMKYVNDTGRF